MGAHARALQALQAGRTPMRPASRCSISDLVASACASGATPGRACALQPAGCIGVLAHCLSDRRHLLHAGYQPEAQLSAIRNFSPNECREASSVGMMHW